LGLEARLAVCRNVHHRDFVASAILWFINPEIYIARSRFRKDTKRWDKILLPFLLAAMLGIFPVAALDDGRFHWFSVPWSIVGVGYFLFLAGFALTAWAQAVNRFFEPTVRIQTDRGMAFGSVREVEYQLSIAARLGYMPEDVAAKVTQQADETAKVLAGLLRSLRAEA
jgi:hypothetical protein